MADARTPLVYSFEAAAVARLIRALRHDMGLRDEEIAAILSVRAGALSDWERGRAWTPPPILTAFIETFGVSPEVLTRDLLEAVARYLAAEKATTEAEAEPGTETRAGDGPSPYGPWEGPIPNPFAHEFPLSEIHTRSVNREAIYRIMVHTTVVAGMRWAR